MTADVRAVYFIGEPGGLIKIGVSENPSRRLAGLQTATPVPLALLATIPGVGVAGERDLHEQFADQRVRGEWFRPSPGLLQVIDSAAHGPKTAESLPASPVPTRPQHDKRLPEVMTPAELAAYLKVSIATVRRPAKTGALPSIRAVGIRRFRRDAIEALLAGEAS